MHPKVTVLLPYFNSADCMSDAIESILCQTLEDFELFLIDIGSSDNSYVLANDYASQDSRASIISEQAGNYVKALTLGIEQSSADYIAIMDARDISFPDRLQKQFDALEENSNFGLVSAQIRNTVEIEMDEEAERFNQYLSWTNRIITTEDFIVNQFIETPFIFSTAMFRKELVNAFEGLKSGDFPTEFELTMRWLRNGVQMYKIPEALYDWTYSYERFNYTEDRFFEQGLYETKSYYLNKYLQDINPFYPDAAIWGAGRSSRQKFYILHELGVNAKFFIDLRANPEHKVIQFQNTPPAGRNFIISYVSNRVAREKIRIFLVELGYVEGKDFICVA